MWAIENKMAVWLSMPKYKEFSCKTVWNFVKEVPDILKYFYDQYSFLYSSAPSWGGVQET